MSCINKSKSILFNFGSGEGFFISVDFFSYFPETISLQLHYLYNYSFQKLSQMALAKSKLLTPGTAILIGGVCYGSWAIWMARNYFHRSSIRKVYVESDKEYERVHPMQKIQYEGNYKSQ